MIFCDPILLAAVTAGLCLSIQATQARSDSEPAWRRPAAIDLPFHLELRRGGRRVGSEWLANFDDVERALGASDADHAVFFVVLEAREVASGDVASTFSNVHRGLRGAIVSMDGRTERISPIDAITRNESFRRSFERLGMVRADKLVALEGMVFRIDVSGDESAIEPVPRLQRRVDLESVTRDRVAELERAWLGYLLRHIDDDGAAAYKFWPSRERFSDANNMIRQWMATEIMLRYLDDPELTEIQRERLVRNASSNAERYLTELEDGRLVVLFESKAKLGSAAIAAMALDRASAADARFEPQARALEASVLSALRDSGRYRTFFVPADRDDNQNFYPGEAQLMLARLYERTREPGHREAFDRAFAYYRDWHLEPDNRNPAFVPWHTQACAIMWRLTGEDRYLEFIFEINDWLLPIQDRDPIYPDLGGRFYQHEFRRYGPPHASSTAVYLEGLVDAWAIAREVGHTERAGRYLEAIRHGFRSLDQLTVRRVEDLFYVADGTAERCLGGVRTTVYHNEIRIDNVQHALSAAQKFLAESSTDPWASGQERPAP